MDRYDFYGPDAMQKYDYTKVKRPDGEWVRYADHKAAMLKYQVNMNALVERLQSRVRELKELINEISPAIWDDDRMKYVNVQVSRDTYDQIQALKGGA